VTAAYNTERARLGRELTSLNLARPPHGGQTSPRVGGRPGQNFREAPHLLKRSGLEACEILDSFTPAADDFCPAKDPD